MPRLPVGEGMIARTAVDYEEIRLLPQTHVADAGEEEARHRVLRGGRKKRRGRRRMPT